LRREPGEDANDRPTAHLGSRYEDARTDGREKMATALIDGETGAGKELIAWAIHIAARAGSGR